MKTYEIKLRPRGTIDRPPSSDRIYGALCWAASALYPESKLWFKEKPETFIVSSCFLYACDIRFLPLPQEPAVGKRETDALLKDRAIFDLLTAGADAKSDKLAEIRIALKNKKFSKVKEASESILLKRLRGQSRAESLRDFITGEVVEYDGRLVSKKENGILAQTLGGENTGLASKAVRPHASLDRLTNTTGDEGSFYHDAVMHINPKAELFFWVKTEQTDLLAVLLRYLKDTGIGGNRSSGMNQYHISAPHPAASQLLNNLGPMVMLLSRMIPADGEAALLLGGEAQYDLLVNRPRTESRGLMGGDVIKGRVICLKEGSVFKVAKQAEYLGMVTVVRETEGRKIMHNGLGFPVYFGGK